MHLKTKFFSLLCFFVLGKRLIALQKANPSLIFLFGLGPGLGDFCYSMAFVPQLLQRNKNKTPLFIISSKNERYLKYFPSIENFLIVREKTYQFLTKHGQQYFLYLKNTKLQNHLVVLNPYFENNSFSNDRLIEECKQLKIEMDPSLFCFPEVNCQIARNVPSHPFVIINEDSSSARLPKSIFSKIAIELVQNGVEIIENSNSANAITLEELFYLSLRALAFISIRSGVLDFIISSKVSIVALYPSDRLGSHLKDSYSLKSWGCKNKLLEIYDVNSETVRKAVSFVLSLRPKK